MVLGLFAFAFIGVLGLIALRAPRAQYRSFMLGWRGLVLITAIETVAQGVLAVWLSYWVSALLFNSYVPKLILIVAVLAGVAVFTVVHALFKALPPPDPLEAELVPETEAPSLWQRELATTDSPLSSVAWSPDGKFIYFTSSTGIEQLSVTGGAPTHVTDAAEATELDVSVDGAAFIWVKRGNLLESLRRNRPNPVATEEAHHGRYPRFDENGAVPGFVYVGLDGAGHPLQRDLLGSGACRGT